MINVKTEVYKSIKDISTNVSDSYPADWATFPAIQYTEEDNKVAEWVDNEESKSYLRYRIDIWDNKSTSSTALEIDKRISNLGLKRTMCQDVSDTSGLKHKVMRYEGIIDTSTEFVYHV